MAFTVLKAPPAFLSTYSGNSFLKSPNFPRVSFLPSKLRCCAQSSRLASRSIRSTYSHRKFVAFSSNGENVGVQTETQGEDSVNVSESELELEIEAVDLNGQKVKRMPPNKQENMDGAVAVDSPSETDVAVAEEPSSVVLSSLNLYKEAIANNDETKSAEIESFLKSMEAEKTVLERKVVTLSEELSIERDRILRISADFDNFRKRTEKERLSLMKNAQGEVVEKLVSVLDNFERAKAQIKVETEGEEKIVNSYQSIYKQFTEILASLGVTSVETVGKPFDPMLHEAISRGDSTEYEEDIIMEEYRKGFQLGERLLRPSMVKVSAGPGPAKPEVGAESRQEVPERSAEENVKATTADE